MLKKYSKRALAFLMLILTLLSTFSNIVFATTEVTYAQIQDGGDCGRHLQFWDEDRGVWSYIIATYAYYEQNGNQYPAYCLNKFVPGVGGQAEGESYGVNVSEVMQDVRLWRVVINGYPYQSPESMGVYNQYDAFVATKQSVYCILYGTDPETYFNGADDEGVAIKNAIIRLVNIGKNGSQTPYNTDVTTSKIGDLYEDGDYYSQEYSINSPVETSNYYVTATNGMPSGSIIANMSNNSQTAFSGNEHFKIRIPKSQMTQDLNIVIALRAKCKTYPVFYGKTTIEGTQDYMLTYDPFGDVTGRATLNAKTNTGKIEINKTDSETKKPIEGVTFKLIKDDGTIIANATTNANGIASFPSLYQGNYKLQEISTNDNYIINNTTFDVNVEYNKITTKSMTNDHKKGNLKIYKIDKDNRRVVLGNVEFQLYSDEFQKVIGTYYTDVNGELEIKNLRTGSYQLKETKTNKWYNLSGNTDIKIEWDKETTKDIENELKKGQIKIIKVDQDNQEVKLEGVEFEVLDENGNILEKLITDKNGEALTSRYPIRDFSKLQLKETKTLENYVLSDETKTITLTENQITNITFQNEKVKGKVEITKVDKNDNTKFLEGAKFGLYNEKDELIETLTTDSNGKAISQDLVKGKYYLKELDTGSVYYLLNKDSFDFEIVKNKETVPIKIDNEGTDIQVTVDKTGTTEIKPGEKVNYTFSNVGNASNIYLDNFKWFDYIPTDYERLEKMTTGTWNQDLTYSVYYKTNKSDDYRVLKKELSTKDNNDLDFTTLSLSEGEYVTEIMYNFGKVDVGFKESTSPTMECKSFDTLKENDTFTNYTKTVGIYYGITAEANSKWTTIVHIPEEKHEVLLPRTGK